MSQLPIRLEVGTTHQCNSRAIRLEVGTAHRCNVDENLQRAEFTCVAAQRGGIGVR
jgi:hypothetical protein